MVMKKILLIFLFSILSFEIVNAKEISLNDIKEKLNNNIININSSIKDNKLIINNNNKELIFNEENNVLVRTDKYEVNTYDSVDDLYIYLILTKAIASLNGYSDKDIEYFLSGFDKATFEDEGYESNKKRIDNYLEITFKINLNKVNIHLDYIDALKPEVIIDNVYKNQVEMHINLDDNADVDIYRSTDNKNFEYVNTLSVKNGSSIYYVNKNLDKDTYYYKAVVKKSNNYSDVVKVKIANNIKDTNYLDETTSNPLTGYEGFIAVSLLVIIAIIGIIGNINFIRALLPQKGKS